MSIGSVIRRTAGPRFERSLSTVYRRIFVDLDAVAAVLAIKCPRNIRILDIGGGDGELLNRLFARRPDLQVDMVDIAPSVGKFVEPEHEPRIRRFPGTAVESLPAFTGGYGAALISDVMHHLPPDYRRAFLSATYATLAPGAPMFVKDVEPGHPIATLGFLCDRYISGDSGVSLVSIQELRKLCDHMPVHSFEEVGLICTNRPNYLVKLTFGAVNALS